MSTGRRDSPVRASTHDDPGFPDDHERFKAGDKAALLRVIMICSQCDYRMPEWAREAFYQIYWNWPEIKSWDDVFGKPWGRGQRRAALTQLQQNDVWSRILKLHEKEGAAIDNELFERVGKELGLSRSTVSKLYYQRDRLLEICTRNQLELWASRNPQIRYELDKYGWVLELLGPKSRKRIISAFFR